jgi:hypothetical protein
MNMKKVLMLLAAAAVGLGAVNASAEDRILPGMLCQGISGGQPFVGWQGGMSNGTTQSNLQVSCPIIRDNVQALPTQIWVSMLNPTSTNIASCQFYATDIFDANNVIWSPNRTDWSWAANPQVKFVAPTLPGGVNPTDFTEFLYCVVPPYGNGGLSSLLMYQVLES